MCGIAGFKLNNSNTNCSIWLNQMNDALNKRGPDDKGIYTKEDRVGLAHSRLSIIDLTTGHQPMVDKKSGVVLVFNGEIYNYRYLKSQLINAGYLFNTSSDTEVILTGYLHWGINQLLQNLEGMFAFALFNPLNDELIIARDRFGEKPLYFSENATGLFFGSELKALKPVIENLTINQNALQLYFALTYIPAPYTIYNEVYKLLPGTYLIQSGNQKAKQNKYYNILDIAQLGSNKPLEDYDQAKIELKKLLYQSVESRMVSDVPIGAFLSGGIDSSIISTIMTEISGKPIDTYSIGFKEKAYDESDRAQLVATKIKSNHHLHTLALDDLLNDLEEVIGYFDEPFGDSSAVPANQVAKMASKHVKVVLTGDAADELFGGYEKYLGNYYSDKWNSNPNWIKNLLSKTIQIIPHNNITNHTLRKVKKVISSASLSAEQRYWELTCLGFNQNQIENILVQFEPNFTANDEYEFYNELKSDSDLNHWLYSDINLVLEGDMLTKVDRMGMLNSLEARVPFLDSDLVKFALSLPASFKVNKTSKKYILKDTFKDILPQQTAGFSKKGFGLPLRIWFKNELKSSLELTLNSQKIKEQGILNSNYIQELIAEHQSGQQNHSTKLWLIWVFQKWYDKHVA